MSLNIDLDNIVANEMTTAQLESQEAEIARLRSQVAARQQPETTAREARRPAPEPRPEATARKAAVTTPQPRPQKTETKAPPAASKAPAWESIAEKHARGAVDDKTLATAVAGTSDLRKQVKASLKEERARVAERAKELAKVEGELAKLATKEQADVGALRQRLEQLDKRLNHAERDLKAKADAYRAAEKEAEKLRSEKTELREHLAMMVLGAEDRKEAKLRELLAVTTDTR